MLYKIMERIPLTKAMINELKSELARTQITLKFLSSKADIPRTSLANIVGRYQKSVVSRDWERVITFLKSLPDGAAPPKKSRSKKTISRELPTELCESVTELASLLDVIDAPPHRVFKGRKDMPSGFRPSLIKGWMRDDGQHIDPEHLSYALSVLRSLQSDDLCLIPVEGAFRSKLLSEQERTGLQAVALLRLMPQCPNGLNAALLNRLYSGRQESVRQDFAQLILDTYARVPTAL